MKSKTLTRWGNRIFGLSAFAILAGFAAVGILRGYGATATLGYLFVNLGWMLMTWLVVGLVLYALVVVVGRAEKAGGNETELPLEDKIFKVNDDEDQKSYYVP